MKKLNTEKGAVKEAGEGREEDDFLWFRPLIFRWFAGVAVFVGFGMAVYGLFLKGSYVPFALGIGAVSLALLILGRFIPYQAAAFILLLVLTVMVAMRSAAIHSALNASFLCIILIVGSIMTTPLLTTVLFAVHMSFVLVAASLGYFSFVQKQDPSTGLYYADTVTVLIPFMIIAYVVSMVVSRVLIGTIHKQVEQYRLLRKTQERLLMQEKMASLRILTGGIAHDFNNILTSILGNINLIRLYPGDEETLLAGLADAEKAAIRARNLTGQLLMVSKGESPFKSVSSLEETLVDTVKFSLHGSRALPVLEIAPELWPVDADIMQISQVIQNLVINADQAMPGGGTVTVSAENVVIDKHTKLPLPEGEYVRICVRDQGVGISAGNLDKIYDPFFTTRQDGTGLGLTICYSIVNNHDGIINVDSVPGVGTEFCFYLPACAGREPVGREKTAAKKPVTGRVLIVDDDEGVIGVLGRMLRLIGYEVHSALSGEQALALFQEEHTGGRGFLFVVMDLTIPGGMNGIETLKRLRAIDPAVKAIISSGYSGDQLEDNKDLPGVDAVLPKPYTMDELIDILNDLLDGKT